MTIEATHLVKPLPGVLPTTLKIGPFDECASFYIVASGFGASMATELRINTRGETGEEAEQLWNEAWRQQVRGQQL